MKILTYLLLFSALLIFSCKEKPVSSKVKSNGAPSHLTKNSKSDTSSSNQTIVIEGVNDPRQLQEILTLLESYSAANKMKDIKIKYLNTKGEENKE